jgi:outer membrane protein assembly factor BamA
LGRGLVLASGARLGLARTIEDEVLIPSERFFAGGANTVRGYREDDLGARSVFDDAEGGEGLLVLNGELRFPIYRWLKGVGFVDVGNVFPKARDISDSIRPRHSGQPSIVRSEMAASYWVGARVLGSRVRGSRLAGSQSRWYSEATRCLDSCPLPLSTTGSNPRTREPRTCENVIVL